MSLAIAREYLDLVKFHHTLFALPFALLGAALAAWSPDGWRGRVQDWLGILLCMATARSAAMAFNRLVDRDYDAMNPRTAGRHLPAGRLRAPSVALFTAACALGFIASTLLFLPNRLPLFLSVPVLLWLLGYSYTKRFTSLAHFWLGASLSFAPVAAWIALRGDIAWPPVLLALAVLFWVAGFDIIYACQDVAFDRQAGLKSVPNRLGIPLALRIAASLPRPDARRARRPGPVLPARPRLLCRGGRGRAPAPLRARPGPSRRPDPREPGLLPRERRHQPGIARRRRGGPDDLTDHLRLMIPSVPTRISETRLRDEAEGRRYADRSDTAGGDPGKG